MKSQSHYYVPVSVAVDALCVVRLEKVRLAVCRSDVEPLAEHAVVRVVVLDRRDGERRAVLVLKPVHCQQGAPLLVEGKQLRANS